MRRSWVGTENGLIANVRESNGTVCEMDELGSGDASTVFKVMYAIANGSPKLRAAASGKLLVEAPHSCVVLATGEVDLRDIAVAGKQTYTDGLDARFLVLPVDEENPMFQNLHGFASGRELSDHLLDATTKHYGVLGRKVVRLLAKRRNDGKSIGMKQCDTYYQQLKDAVAADRLPRQFDRVAKQFAIFATAGEFAIFTGLLGLTKGDALAAAQYGLAAWARRQLAIEREPHARRLAEVRQWLMVLASGEEIPTYSATTLSDGNVPAMRHRYKNGTRVILVKQEALAQKFGRKCQPWASALRAAGHLIPGSRPGYIRQVRIPGGADTPGFYVIAEEFIE
jgi:putative DNA primase/helicase